MLWIPFLVDCIPAALGVLGMLATVAIVLRPRQKTNEEASVRRFRILSWQGRKRITLATLVVLVVGISVWRLRLPRPYGLTREEREFFAKNPHVLDPRWMNALLPTGIAAPDFTLPEPRTGAPVSFSQYRGGRPAVLVLGSVGCNLFCDSIGGVRRLYDQYNEQVAFVFVQVTNAPHPLPEAVLRSFQEAHAEKPSSGNRGTRARIAANYLGFPFPCLLDTEDKRVENLYDAFPRRLLVIQPDGRIARDFGRGLNGDWDFNAIQACVAKQLDKTMPAKAALHAAAVPKDVPSLPR